MLSMLKSPYVLIFVWLLFMYMIINMNYSYEYVDIQGKNEKRLKKWPAFIMILPLIIWVGLRTNSMGADTGAYRHLFMELSGSLKDIPSYFINDAKDPGFSALGTFLKFFIGNRDQIYFLIIAFLQGWCLYRVYRKYSINYTASIFLFLASSDYVSWMFNGMRQFIVAAILFSCVDLILEKQYVKMIIIILLLSTIHQSVLIVIPFLFICQGKAWNSLTIFTLLAVVFAVVFLGEFTAVLDEVLSETQYSQVTTQMLEDDGVNGLRVLVYSVPTILSFIFRKRIVASNSKVINMATNMCIISTAFYIIGMFTSGIYIGRIPIYFSLYGYILLPWLIEKVFERRSAQFIYFMMIGFYMLFYIYQMHFAWGMF